MTFITNLWDRFVTNLLRPFVRIQQDRLKLQHTIEMDKESGRERHLEAILSSQEALAREMHATVSESTAVLRDWLDGFHKIQATPGVAPPVNDDERMWRLEMERIGSSIGVDTKGMASSDIEALIRQELNSL